MTAIIVAFLVAAESVSSAGSPDRALPPAESAAGPLRPGAASAATDEDIRRRLDALLNLRDGAISPAQWRTLGPRANPLLEQVTTDQDALPTRRARALEGLVALGSPKAAVNQIEDLDGQCDLRSRLPCCWPRRVASW